FGVPDRETQQAASREDERPNNEPRLAVPDAFPAQPVPEPAQQQTTIISPLASEAAAGGEGAVSANLTVTIIADEDTNTLLIRATPREYRQLLSTISGLDSQPPQVLINAVIGQVTLNESTRFGIDWTRMSDNSRLNTEFLPNLFQ